MDLSGLLNNYFIIDAREALNASEEFFNQCCEMDNAAMIMDMLNRENWESRKAGKFKEVVENG